MMLKLLIKHILQPTPTHRPTIIESTIEEFRLNREQERALKLAGLSTTGKLKMYLGGMGGKGKSRVIKALVSFFEK